MSNITWVQYGIFIAVATLLYYIIIVFIFFKGKKMSFLGREPAKAYTDNNETKSFDTFSIKQEESFIDKKIVTREQYMEDDISYNLPEHLFDEALPNITPTQEEIKEILSVKENSHTETDIIQQATESLNISEKDKQEKVTENFVIENEKEIIIDLKNEIVKEDSSADVSKVNNSSEAKQTSENTAKDSILHLIKKTKKGNQ